MTTGRPITALIVEDNELFRQVLKTSLHTRFPSIAVFEAEDLTEGHHQVSERAPDIVFLDICLPDGNGLELAERIQRELPSAIVVICTSYDLPEYRQAATARRISHFLPKEDFRMQQISDVVEEAIERAKAS